MKNRIFKSNQSTKPNSRKGISVTICVAAVCNALPPNDKFPMIVGASDRMLTAGDIEFEPEVPKTVPITNSIFVLLAGDSSLQTEIMQQTYVVVNGRIKEDPKNWWKVKDVAEVYSRFYRDTISKHAQHAILSPLSLNYESFLEKQRLMAPEQVREICSQLQAFELNTSVAAIVCGMDQDNAHIYVVNNGHIQNRDIVGFAAIGAGDWHANSQFMFAKHTRTRGFAETLLLTYIAKKRAEVAPGVGAATDMFTVGPYLGQNIYPVGDHVLAKLGEIYDETSASIKRSEDEARKVVADFFKQQTEKNAAQQSATPSITPISSSTEQPPPDGQSLPSGHPKEKQP
jgi:hypothetical protein